MRRLPSLKGPEVPDVKFKCSRWSIAQVLALGALVGGAQFLPLAAADAQDWNDARVMPLVQRGIDRRQMAQADSSLTSYRTRAHGFLFFLAQLGEGLAEPPRLVKADELQVEVYWQAPDRSKQVILGWRDGSWLPTDINYHRDHLGIVTNNFGDRIRIGDGDEVRDVIHPLSPAGLTSYDFALRDSITLHAGNRAITVYEIAVRPRDFKRPLVVGTLYIDVETAVLVRFRFSFTPAAYLDKQLEDISIVLENSLWEEKYWLPYRQEVELRRRTTWLDFPARGIIRGRWEIGNYEFNVPLDSAALTGPSIAGLRLPRNDDSTEFSGSLDSAVAQVAAPINAQDMDALRVEVERIAGTRALGGLANRRLAARSVSDIVKVNRVQGLTFGFGATIGSATNRIQVEPYAAFGTSDERLLGSLAVAVNAGATHLRAEGYRRIRDFGELPVITPVFNSITSQEFGKDYGDYVLLEGASLALRHRLSGRTTFGGAVFRERSKSVEVAASPATGSYRPNPLLGAGDYTGIRLRLERASGGIAVTHDLQGALSVEAADGPAGYFRANAESRWLTHVAGREVVSRAYLGWGSDHLPAYRSFVLGGRNTLPGEPFRAFGGRSMALVQTEWRFEAPFPAIPLGSFASTGHTIVVAPFLAAGWTERPVGDTPWNESDGVRPVAGIALEWFMRLVRIEAGIGLRNGKAGVTFEIHRDWWSIL
ncbi:MAG: hypothetical protein ABI679_00680 [Gemmatimonadota bacterium]